MNASVEHKNIPLVAAEHMGKQLLETVLQELRVAPDVWQKMNERQQAETIDRVRHAVTYAVAGAVNTIVSAENPTVVGEVEAVQIKDKIKLSLIISRNNHSESLNRLYEAGTGSPVQVLLGTAEQYLGGMELISAEPDQPDMLDNAKQHTPDDDLLWAVSAPIAGKKEGLFPAPNREDAEFYARSMRAELIGLNQGWALTLAKRIYACPWPKVKGEHTRSVDRGDWQTMLTWFSDLLYGSEVQEKPVAMIEHVPEGLDQAGEAKAADTADLDE